MCGRFTLTLQISRICQLLGIDCLTDFNQSYNIAPTQEVLTVIAKENHKKALTKMTWGLILHWANDPTISHKLINARSETILEKPSFNHPFRHNRCLILSDGFYEWEKQGKTKHPYYITTENSSILAFAGLYDHWKNPDTNETITSCTILTTSPNDTVKPLHNRMPVIIPPEYYDQWLFTSESDVNTLLPLLKPYDATPLTAYPVSHAVNNPKHNDPACIERESQQLNLLKP